MGLFKLVTLAMATAATASTYYPGPPAAPSNATEQVSVTTIASTTTIVKGPATSQPPVVSTIVTSAVLPTDVPDEVSSTWIDLSSYESGAANWTSISDFIPSTVVPSGIVSSVTGASSVVTQSVNGTYHSGTASVTPTSTGVPVNAGENLKVGAVVGLAALMAGVFGA
jgi:hypothetical protein